MALGKNVITVGGEPDSQHFYVPQEVLEGQSEVQDDLGKTEYHRDIEQVKGQGLENQPKAWHFVSKFDCLCRRRTYLIKGYTDTRSILTQKHTSTKITSLFYGLRAVSTLTAQTSLEHDSERKEMHRVKRGEVKIKIASKRLEECQSCSVTASKYLEEQEQRAETSHWNECVQAKHTAKLLNICK